MQSFTPLILLALLCSLPKGLNQQPTDLCELGNFVCDPYGRLVKLSLGFAQFSCDLPTELAKFKKLRTLELDDSDFKGSSLDDLAKVCILVLMGWQFGRAKLHGPILNHTAECNCVSVVGLCF